MGVIRSAAVLVLLICSISQLPSECSSADVQADFESDEQIARRVFEHLTQSAEPNDGEGNGLTADGVVDLALEDFRQIMRDEEMERIAIPTFEEKFSKSFIKGSFKGKGGWLTGITSIARKGDASMALHDATVVFESKLGLDMMELDMKYTAQLKPISVSGKLTAKVRGSEVSSSGGLKFSSGECSLFLETLNIEKIGKINIEVTGLGPLNWLTSKIAGWVTSHLEKDIKKTVQQQIREVLEREMGDLECPPSLMPH